MQYTRSTAIIGIIIYQPKGEDLARVRIANSI